jgi:hypothetical protein
MRRPYYESLRSMYPAGRPDHRARRSMRLTSAAIGLGLMPRRWVILEVPGRRSGRLVRLPLGVAEVNGCWYLVPMLGENCNWVRNVRAADGHAVLLRRRPHECQLVEVPVVDRAGILKRYLQKAPGGRPHIPVDRHAPLTDFAAISTRYPVFRVEFLRGASARPAAEQSRA